MSDAYAVVWAPALRLCIVQLKTGPSSNHRSVIEASRMPGLLYGSWFVLRPAGLGSGLQRVGIKLGITVSRSLVEFRRQMQDQAQTV